MAKAEVKYISFIDASAKATAPGRVVSALAELFQALSDLNLRQGESLIDSMGEPFGSEGLKELMPLGRSPKFETVTGRPSRNNRPRKASRS